jgi:hypothetical protein
MARERDRKERQRERVRLCRRRRREGRTIVQLEIELGPVADLLIDGAFLEAWNSEDKRKVVEALEAAISVWARA